MEKKTLSLWHQKEKIMKKRILTSSPLENCVSAMACQVTLAASAPITPCVPPFTYEKLLANLGSMKNSGMEIGFGITPLRTNDMELTINMNWSFERNKLISLNGYYNGPKSQPAAKCRLLRNHTSKILT